MKEAGTSIVEWGRQHKMTLNTKTSEVAFFTRNLHEAQWQTTVHLEGQPLRFTPPPRNLGVTLCRALSFGQHIASISVKAASRCRVFTSLTSKQCGWRKYQLTKIYMAQFPSVLMNGPPAWQPWLAATRLEQLETCQNGALRMINCKLQTTPVETLRRETGLRKMTTLKCRQTATAYGKTLS